MFWKLPIKKISYDTKKVTFKSIKDINIIEEMRKEITSLKKNDRRNEKRKKPKRNDYTKRKRKN